MADGYIVTPVPPFHEAVGASFGTFTTRQDVSPTPAPIILPYQLRKSSKIRIVAHGEVASTGTPTIVLGFYLGTGVGATGLPAAITTVIAETGAISLATAAAWPWRMEWEGLINGLGTSATLVGQGNAEIPTSLTAFSSIAFPTTQALRSVTFNASVANAIGVCATYSASNAANTVRVNSLAAYLMN